MRPLVQFLGVALLAFSSSDANAAALAQTDTTQAAPEATTPSKTRRLEHSNGGYLAGPFPVGDWGKVAGFGLALFVLGTAGFDTYWTKSELAGTASPRASCRHHAGTIARTRSGLPLPPTILSGAAITTAPVAGNRSRLVRLASPNFPAPCIVA